MMKQGGMKGMGGGMMMGQMTEHQVEGIKVCRVVGTGRNGVVVLTFPRYWR